MRKLALFVTLIAATSTTAVSTDALAADEVNSQLAYALRMAPGGVQTAWNQVTWPDGTVLIIERGGTAGRPDAAASLCASGKFCAFTEPNGAGTHLDFTACPSTNSVAALPQVRSIANARSSGTVTGRKGSTVIVSVSPGATKNVTRVIDKVVCS